MALVVGVRLGEGFEVESEVDHGLAYKVVIILE